MPNESDHPAPKVTRVLVGDPVRVNASRAGARMDAVDSVEWKFYALRDGARADVGCIERPFSGSRAAGVWAAKGPREERERSCEVIYTVKAGSVARDGHENITTLGAQGVHLL